MRQSEFKKRYDVKMGRYVKKHIYGKGVVIDCKTVGFFLKISKEIGKAWRKSLTRARRASLTRP